MQLNGRSFEQGNETSNSIKYGEFDFCLTVHHQLGKIHVIQMNQIDATMIY